MKLLLIYFLLLLLHAITTTIVVHAQSNSKKDIFLYEETRRDITSIQHNYPAYSDASEYKLRAQGEWYKVSTSDMKEHIYDWEGRTEYIRYDDNECNVNKYQKQSPILLKDDGSKCGDEHRMRGKSIARCQFSNMNFTTTSHSLSMKVDGCLSHDGQIPKIDFSHLPSNFHLTEMYIKTPSEHCWERNTNDRGVECFDGELVFSHYGELTNKGDHRRDVLNLAAMIQVVPDSELDEYNSQASKKHKVPNKHYNKMLKQWARVQQRQYRRCSNRDDETYFDTYDIEWGEDLCDLKQKVRDAYEYKKRINTRRNLRGQVLVDDEINSKNNNDTMNTSSTTNNNNNHGTKTSKKIYPFLEYLGLLNNDNNEDDTGSDFLSDLLDNDDDDDDDDDDDIDEWLNYHGEWFEQTLDDNTNSTIITTINNNIHTNDVQRTHNSTQRQRQRRQLKGDIKIYSKFLPQNHYYRYEGSMTTPPCMDRVHWRIMRIPFKISEMQYRITKYLLSAHINNECILASVGRPKNDGSCEVEVNRRLQKFSKEHDLQDCWKWNGKKWNNREFIYDPKYISPNDNKLDEGEVIPVVSVSSAPIKTNEGDVIPVQSAPGASNEINDPV